jgi:hypothetical protein
MNTISFSTLAGRTFQDVPFDINQFYDYMTHCGVPGIPSDNQIILLLNNLYEVILATNPYDSVIKIEYAYQDNQEFKEKYELIDNMLKYNV